MTSGSLIHLPGSLCPPAVELTCHAHNAVWQPDPPATLTTSFGGRIHLPRSVGSPAVEFTRRPRYVVWQRDSPATLTMFSGSRIHPPPSLYSLAARSTCHAHYVPRQVNLPAQLTTHLAARSTRHARCVHRRSNPPATLVPDYVLWRQDPHTQPFLAVESTCQSRCFLWQPDAPAMKLQQIAPPTYSLCKITLPTPSICLATCSPRPAVKSHRQHFYFDWWWNHTANMLYGIFTPHTHSFRLAI
ncbi:hypothetical protein DFH08DRAFT_1077871 [Mycena albidolilacea]|uniref:Uncharacterized protein n=1 Tax=Mycena albidolilacea TaxID=1033008 RepID=A0AAD7A9F6_9AGAR|nr:hypothetical protein DFH08DRAFT_1077871 [Mycena albidolilacea]